LYVAYLTRDAQRTLAQEGVNDKSLLGRK